MHTDNNRNWVGIKRHKRPNWTIRSAQFHLLSTTTTPSSSPRRLFLWRPVTVKWPWHVLSTCCCPEAYIRGRGWVDLSRLPYGAPTDCDGCGGRHLMTASPAGRPARRYCLIAATEDLSAPQEYIMEALTESSRCYTKGDTWQVRCWGSELCFRTVKNQAMGCLLSFIAAYSTMISNRFYRVLQAIRYASLPHESQRHLIFVIMGSCSWLLCAINR